MGFRTAPAQNLGYYRASDWPTATGSGPTMPTTPTASPGQNGSMTSPGNWHPTVLWMLGFVAAELIGFHLLGRLLKI